MRYWMEEGETGGVDVWVEDDYGNVYRDHSVDTSQEAWDRISDLEGDDQ